MYTPGSVTLSGFGERHGQDATIHVRLIGSPAATPTGTVSIPIPGAVLSPPARLVELVPGTAEADITLINPGAGFLTLHLAYSGDSNYNAQNQDVRLGEGRKRIGRH